MSLFAEKLKETFISVAPVTVLVGLLSLFVDMPLGVMPRFYIGAMCIFFGLALFLFGVDLAVEPVGNGIGGALARKKKLGILVLAGLGLGFFINIAEPDLFVLATQVRDVTDGAIGVFQILMVVSLGVGFLVALGLLRVVFGISLRTLLWILYGLILLLALVSPSAFYGIAFDAGGATTGSMTVPFILALGMGVSAVSGGKKAEENAFGLVAVASTGPMLAVLAMAKLSGASDLHGEAEQAVAHGSEVLSLFITTTGHVMQEVGMALLPFFVLTLLAQKVLLHMNPYAFRRVMIGFIYTFFGFVLFLVGVQAGFMDAGKALGILLLEKPTFILLLIAAAIGVAVILAEPAVHVLTAQVEDITGGAVSARAVTATLALGVAAAIVVSVLRLIVPSLSLSLLLLVGYGLALILTFFAPPLFVGIAFDSGGVASGPMTATFVLAFAQGLAGASTKVTVLDAFGVIAMVALVPLITLQIFGIYYGWRLKKTEKE